MTNTALTEPTETQGMLRPNAKRAKNAIIGLKCVLIMEFVSIFFLYLEYSLLSYVSSMLVQRYPETEGILPMKLLHVWWFFYIVLNIIAFILTYLYINIDSVKDILTINGINTAFSVVNISLSILTIKVVRRYAEAERLLARIREENNEI